MDGRIFEQTLERLMKLDFSVGTEEFRDDLLSRCLDVLGEDDECAVLDDDVLDLLAAAGDRYAFDNVGMDSRGRIGDNKGLEDLS